MKKCKCHSVTVSQSSEKRRLRAMGQVVHNCFSKWRSVAVLTAGRTENVPSLCQDFSILPFYPSISRQRGKIYARTREIYFSNVGAKFFE